MVGGGAGWGRYITWGRLCGRVLPPSPLCIRPGTFSFPPTSNPLPPLLPFPSPTPCPLHCRIQTWGPTPSPFLLLRIICVQLRTSLPPLVLTSSGGHLNVYGCQTDGMHHTGMLFCLSCDLNICVVWSALSTADPNRCFCTQIMMCNMM